MKTPLRRLATKLPSFSNMNFLPYLYTAQIMRAYLNIVKIAGKISLWQLGLRLRLRITTAT